MRVLEIGNYIAPAYAGMILAEQGHDVTKLCTDRDPTLQLDRGQELWEWLNAGKTLLHDIDLVAIVETLAAYGPFDVVIDNFRASTLSDRGVDPDILATFFDLSWVSLRSDVGERSFDVIAQARSWMEYGPYVPFYLGDTAAGLWLAFKALSMHAQRDSSHAIIYQASALQKMVEGELIIDVERDGKRVPWDRELYEADENGATVAYRGETYLEPVRDRRWKLDHLHHVNGRMRI